MRLLFAILSAVVCLVGVGFLFYSITLPNQYYASSAVQQGALYSMGVMYAVVGVGSLVLSGVLALVYYGGEISEKLVEQTITANANAWKDNLGGMPMSEEQRRLMERARALIQQGKRDEARKLLERIGHPKAEEWIAKLTEST